MKIIAIANKHYLQVKQSELGKLPKVAQNLFVQNLWTNIDSLKDGLNRLIQNQYVTETMEKDLNYCLNMGTILSRLLSRPPFNDPSALAIIQEFTSVLERDLIKIENKKMSIVSRDTLNKARENFLKLTARLKETNPK